MHTTLRQLTSSRHRHRATWLAPMVALLVVGCSIGPDVAGRRPLPEGALRVLFVGNSLTDSNDLPAIVAALAAPDTTHPLAYGAVTASNFSLEDHWYAGTARQAIVEGSWHYVVMQQGSSALPQSQEHLRHWTGVFAEEIRAAGATPALFMVWPSARRQFDFDAVVHSYTEAARANDAVLLPVGSAWLATWERDDSIALYSDGLHPNILGSYLAALVIYGGLYERSPVGLPYTLDLDGGRTIRIDSTTAVVLQAAAAEVLARTNAVRTPAR